MDEVKASRVVVVCNEEGVHLRAASAFVKLARQFQSRVTVMKNHERVDGKSTPLQLTALGAKMGDQVLLEAEGPDAEEAIGALAALFANKFEDQPGPHKA
jgi:phosphocarrier protein HPr